jgi:hypothetical protein
MVRLVIVSSAVVAWMAGQAFTFTIGSPVAAMDGRSKLAAFVFRTESCADLKNLRARPDRTEWLHQGLFEVLLPPAGSV